MLLEKLKGTRLANILNVHCRIHKSELYDLDLILTTASANCSLKCIIITIIIIIIIINKIEPPDKNTKVSIMHKSLILP
jgi:hypothetical protein